MMFHKDSNLIFDIDFNMFFNADFMCFVNAGIYMILNVGMYLTTNVAVTVLRMSQLCYRRRKRRRVCGRPFQMSRFFEYHVFPRFPGTPDFVLFPIFPG